MDNENIDFPKSGILVLIFITIFFLYGKFVSFKHVFNSILITNYTLPPGSAAKWRVWIIINQRFLKPLNDLSWKLKKLQRRERRTFFAILYLFSTHVKERTIVLSHHSYSMRINFHHSNSYVSVEGKFPYLLNYWIKITNMKHAKETKAF